MAEGRVLTRWDLDEISSDHPIMVLQVAGHWGVVKSKALEFGGVTDASADLEGGRFGRDTSGTLTRLLLELRRFSISRIRKPRAARSARNVAPASTPAQRRRGLQLGMTVFHRALTAAIFTVDFRAAYVYGTAPAY